VDEVGRPVRVIITSGTINDCTKADELITGIEAAGVIADKGYDTNAIVEAIILSDMQVVIPPKKNRNEQRGYDKQLYKIRHFVENAFAVLKRWRGIATRYAKHTKSYLSAVQIACISSWN
jgi:transposase